MSFALQLLKIFVKRKGAELAQPRYKPTIVLQIERYNYQYLTFVTCIFMNRYYSSQCCQSSPAVANGCIHRISSSSQHPHQHLPSQSILDHHKFAPRSTAAETTAVAVKANYFDTPGETQQPLLSKDPEACGRRHPVLHRSSSSSSLGGECQRLLSGSAVSDDWPCRRTAVVGAVGRQRPSVASVSADDVMAIRYCSPSAIALQI